MYAAIYFDIKNLYLYVYFLPQIGNEVVAINHLVEAHAVILRQHILHRYQKTQLREAMWNESQVYGLRPTHVKFRTKFSDELLKAKLLNLPKGNECFYLLLYLLYLFYTNLLNFFNFHRMVHNSDYCSL